MSRGLTEKPALTATNGLAYLACIMRTDCERAGDRSCLCKEGASCLCEVNRSHLCDEPRFLLNCQAFINNPVPGSLPSAERMTVSVWARDRICTSSPLYYFKGLKWGGGGQHSKQTCPVNPDMPCHNGGSQWAEVPRKLLVRSKEPESPTFRDGREALQARSQGELTAKVIQDQRGG